jgi:hypothetical protein
LFVGYAIAAAFSTYFCMYAFRKPFAAGSFDGELWGIDLKIVLVLSQLVGYALSKFIGIGFVSGVSRGRRAVTIVVLIGLAEIALVAFGLLPPGGKAIAIFFNGLPLGAVWGLVFSFLEGRRTSEILGAGLSTSYIFASGAVKAVGMWLLQLGVTEEWMPAATGAMFLPILVLAVAALRQIPPPTPQDEEARTAREPMSSSQRRAFFATHWPGLLALTLLYMFLTAYRDFRDNFAVEIFAELGETRPSVLALTEVWVAVLVLLCLAAIYLVKDNLKAFFLIHGLMFTGAAMIALSTLAFELQWIGSLTWMTTVGVGLYLGYVPYGCVLFDRLIASTRLIGTAVFMIYVTDALGYVGSIVILIVKNFGDAERTWLSFFLGFSYLCSAVCCICFSFSAIYFWRRLRRQGTRG